MRDRSITCRSLQNMSCGKNPDRLTSEVSFSEIRNVPMYDNMTFLKSSYSTYYTTTIAQVAPFKGLS